MYGENTKTMAIPIYKVLPYLVILVVHVDLMPIIPYIFEVPSSVSFSLQRLLEVIPEIKSTIDSQPSTLRDILKAQKWYLSQPLRT